MTFPPEQSGAGVINGHITKTEKADNWKFCCMNYMESGEPSLLV